MKIERKTAKNGSVTQDQWKIINKKSLPTDLKLYTF